jgi:hypothetical protein
MVRRAVFGRARTTGRARLSAETTWDTGAAAEWAWILSSPRFIDVDEAENWRVDRENMEDFLFCDNYFV